MLFSPQMRALVNSSVGNKHIWLLKNARYLEWYLRMCFLVLFFKKILFLWSLNSFYLLLIMFKEKKTKRKLYWHKIKSFLNENPSWKMTLKKQLIHLFKPFFMTFENLSHVLTLHLLSCLYINDLELAFAHLPEILNGMKLKYMGCIHPKWS